MKNNIPLSNGSNNPNNPNKTDKTDKTWQNRRDMEPENFFVDAREILEYIDRFNFASFFYETRKRAEIKSTISWLKVCDKDTLEMIGQYLSKNGDGAKENTSNDIFDKYSKKTQKIKYKDSFQEEDEYLDEEFSQENYGSMEIDGATDIYALVVLLLAWENENFMVPVEVTEVAADSLEMFVKMEMLRRQGFIKINGSGTLLSENTGFKITTKGKKMTKDIVKELHANPK